MCIRDSACAVRIRRFCQGPVLEQDERAPCARFAVRRHALVQARSEALTACSMPLAEGAFARAVCDECRRVCAAGSRSFSTSSGLWLGPAPAVPVFLPLTERAHKIDTPARRAAPGGPLGLGAADP
eukprot:7242068-Prymnesium_polylepis.1